jgi:hypothetical protein
VDQIANIDFKNTGVDDQTLDLLKKLDVPTKYLVEDIEKHFKSAIKVYLNGICHGLILVRGEISYTNEMTLVVDHAIAADGKNITEVLNMDNALWRWARAAGFQFVRQHADRAGLARILERYYDRIESIAYIKDIRQCQAQNQVAPKQAKAQRPLTINESLMKAE